MHISEGLPTGTWAVHQCPLLQKEWLSLLQQLSTANSFSTSGRVSGVFIPCCYFLTAPVLYRSCADSHRYFECICATVTSCQGLQQTPLLWLFAHCLVFFKFCIFSWKHTWMYILANIMMNTTFVFLKSNKSVHDLSYLSFF